MVTCDVLVIGGGPAGSTCAWKLREAGLDVIVMDRATFPRDKVCGGWITPQVIADLRLHYAKTLQHWSQRFNAQAGEVARMFDDTFVRAWRLYLAGSQAAFNTGCMQLFQVVFARGTSNAIPWTRASAADSEMTRAAG